MDILHQPRYSEQETAALLNRPYRTFRALKAKPDWPLPRHLRRPGRPYNLVLYSAADVDTLKNWLMKYCYTPAPRKARHLLPPLSAWKIAVSADTTVLGYRGWAKTQ